MAKIGIMGGTFNPIHNGHIQMANSAYEQCQLQKILFMPSKIPPHKQGLNIVHENLRSDMVKIAISEFDCFAFSDFELRREGTTYTAETLTLLKEEHPLDQYYFIMGADSFFQFEMWYQPQIICNMASILVVGRDHATKKELLNQKEHLQQRFNADIAILTMEEVPVSSSDIRKRIAHGQSVDTMLPEGVIEYIKEHRLYLS